MKRSMNFRGKPGRHLTLPNLIASLKAVGKTDEEIMAIVAGLYGMPPTTQPATK